MLKRRLFAASLLTAITLTMALVPGAYAKSLKWYTPFTLNCGNPGFLDGGTSATGVVNVYDGKKPATGTVSCTGIDSINGLVNTNKADPTSLPWQLWVYIYAGSVLESTCNSPIIVGFYGYQLTCSNSIYGGATLTINTPYQA